MSKETNKNRSKVTKEKVTKHDVANAHQSKRLVGAAVDALQKIGPQSIGCNQTACSKIADFTEWLNEFIEKADSVIKQGEHQYENRPIDIINAATQRMFEIPGRIELEEKVIQGKMSGHESKVEELRKKGFSAEQISNILPDPRNEIDVSEKLIADMKAEARNIEMFLADSPRYDVNLIKNAKLDMFLQLFKMNNRS